MSIGAILLLAAVAVGALAFLVIASWFARIAKLTAMHRFYLVASGFGVLGVAQVLSALSYLSGSERDAYTFYVGSSSFSMAGYLILLTASGRESRDSAVYAVSPALLLASSVDVVSGLSAVLLAYNSKSIARACFSALGVSHLLKALPLIGGGLNLVFLPPLLVLLGEAVRAASASVLAAYYIKGALGYEEK
ncbi:MAG: hypothetical protein F7C07_06650 [Desulfurococcales archaeon]|nr:hypothetical protein [Desulfurococcales archaeon]